MLVDPGRPEPVEFYSTSESGVGVHVPPARLAGGLTRMRRSAAASGRGDSRAQLKVVEPWAAISIRSALAERPIPVAAIT